MKILILGGNAAGMSAAGRLLRRAPKTKVVVVEKSGEVSYGACGLPYYVGGLNQDLDLMRIRSAEAFRAQGIDLRLFHCVKEVDFSQREAVIQAADGCYREAFDQLLIATGSSAILPPLPGIALPGVYTLKTLADGAALQAALALEENRQVAIVGGGPTGIGRDEIANHSPVPSGLGASRELAAVFLPASWLFRSGVFSHSASRGWENARNAAGLCPVLRRKSCANTAFRSSSERPLSA